MTKNLFNTIALWVVGSLLLPAFAHTQEVRRNFISMDQRIEQVLGVLGEPASCEAAEAAIRLGMETVYGGLRPLPSAALAKDTLEADQKIAAAETGFANALHRFVQGGQCPEQQAMALDLKLFIEQMNEVAVAVGRITIGCRVGQPCPDLVPMLDEATGQEVRGDLNAPLQQGFSLKLRSPFVPPATAKTWEEDLFPTQPIPPGECVAVIKETRGLMVKLHLERIDVVRDPWATPMLARGTRIPIFALEWIPSQYVKTWNVCNVVQPRLVTTATQQVKQDIPLTYFWRYFNAQQTTTHP